MPSTDQRRVARFAVGTPVIIRRSNGSVIGASCDNLSVGGLGVLTETRLFQNEAVEVEAPFLDRNLRFPCRTAYVIELTHPARSLRVGLEFLELDAAASAAVQVFLLAHQPELPRPGQRAG